MEAHETSDHSSQYLTFRVSDENYAIEVLGIKEILPFRGATRMPLTPSVISGLINLRGSAVPVIDLAVRFGLPETQASRRTCVVIVESARGEEGVVMGILADSVNNVIELRSGDLEETPAFGMGLRAECLRGLAKVDGEFLPILDIEQVVAVGDLFELFRAAAAGSDSDGAGHDAAEGSEGDPVQSSGGVTNGEDAVSADGIPVGEDPEPTMSEDDDAEKEDQKSQKKSRE